jgi:chitinase
VGYFPQWGLYDDTPYTVRALLDNKAAGMLDQINYAQGFVTGGRCSIADPNADIEHVYSAEASVDGSADSPTAPVRGNFHQLAELKRLYPHIKILISLEGRGSDFAADAQPEQRTAFVASCVNLFLKGNFNGQASMPGLFDGIDLDWEFPRGADSANYLPLLTEFRRQMDALRPGLVLSVALGPSPRMYGDADVSAVGRIVDEAGLMTYDFNGPWSSTTGFIAPLSSTSDDGSVERSVSAWKTAGMPSEKLLLGLPFYGYGWKQVADTDHGFGQDGRPIRGNHPYRFIQTLIPQAGQPDVAAVNSEGASASSSKPPVLYRDPVSQAPWLFDGDSFWTYEDPISIRSKASYAASQQLGGFMVWELSDDTQDATLLKAAHTALTQPSTGSDGLNSRQVEPASRP